MPPSAMTEVIEKETATAPGMNKVLDAGAAPHCCTDTP